MLKGDAVSEKEKFVRKSSVAEVNLGALLELVFSGAEHDEVIKLIIRPRVTEVIFSFFGKLFLRLRIFFLFLLDAIHVHFVF